MKLVGNGTGSTTNSFVRQSNFGRYREMAQQFTTGSHRDGYTLNSVSIWISGDELADTDNFVAASGG